MNNRTKHF